MRAPAALMDAVDIRMLPVCQNGRPIGIVTDRGIALRLMTRTGAAADVPIREVMSTPIVSCRSSDRIVGAAALMGDHQTRRLIVYDEDGRMVGVVSLGDMARDFSEDIAGQALVEIVEYR